jgi:hypothetical protein
MPLYEEGLHCAAVRFVFACAVSAPQDGGNCEARRRDMVTNDAKDHVSLDAEVEEPVVWLNCSLMLPFAGRCC